MAPCFLNGIITVPTTFGLSTNKILQILKQIWRSNCGSRALLVWYGSALFLVKTMKKYGTRNDKSRLEQSLYGFRHVITLMKPSMYLLLFHSIVG
ncbi:unnamed protein product [Brugia timori]|uniref:Ovule protein n=1 Tax=Brugia timori TaxID=42155 RepID=A0A0R3QX53_9BILA|nr:unnamed protein product [Brugia timori]